MDYSLILSLEYPEDVWDMQNNDYSTLVWMSDSQKPTKKELEALWPEVEYKWQSEKVESARQNAYQMESDPLFFKYQRNEDGITKAAWLAKVEEIRERYPMPEKPAE